MSGFRDSRATSRVPQEDVDVGVQQDGLVHTSAMARREPISL